MKEEPLDADDLDSNKLDNIIDTSLTVKSEVGDDENDVDDDNAAEAADEKKDSGKDVEEEDDGNLLLNEGDIKVEDLEEQNDLEDTKEVGIIRPKSLYITFTFLITKL